MKYFTINVKYGTPNVLYDKGIRHFLGLHGEKRKVIFLQEWKDQRDNFFKI